MQAALLAVGYSPNDIVSIVDYMPLDGRFISTTTLAASRLPDMAKRSSDSLAACSRANCVG